MNTVLLIFPSPALEFVISSVIIMAGFFSKIFIPNPKPSNWWILKRLEVIRFYQDFLTLALQLVNLSEYYLYWRQFVDCRSRFVTGHFKWDWFILSSIKPKCNDKLSIDFVFWLHVFYKDCCSWFGVQIRINFANFI